MSTKKLINCTYLYGVIPKTSIRFDDSNIYEDFPIESAKLKKIKIWFGIPPNKETEKNNIKSLLGIQCIYENYYNNQKKESEYHGCERTSNEIETKELEVTQGDYFNKLNFGFEDYITHIKFTTKKGKIIEFGEVIADNEKTLNVNAEDNIISFPFGKIAEDGIRAFGVKFISKNDYFMRRYKELLILRERFKQDKEKAENYYKDLDKYDIGIKCLILVSMGRITPDAVFASIIRFY